MMHTVQTPDIQSREQSGRIRQDSGKKKTHAHFKNTPCKIQNVPLSSNHQLLITDFDRGLCIQKATKCLCASPVKQATSSSLATKSTFCCNLIFSSHGRGYKTRRRRGRRKARVCGDHRLVIPTSSAPLQLLPHEPPPLLSCS